MMGEWIYQDCEEGLHKGKCCQHCVANGERLCCECEELKKTGKEMMRSKEEIEYLLNGIQDILEDLEEEYKKRKKSLFERAEELKKEVNK